LVPAARLQPVKDVSLDRVHLFLSSRGIHSSAVSAEAGLGTLLIYLGHMRAYDFAADQTGLTRDRVKKLRGLQLLLSP
jgi:hypothetical protein